MRLIYQICLAGLLGLAGIFPHTLLAQLTADFSFTPASPICAGTQVSFTDLSTGGATSWNWTFSTGNGSTVQNPTLTFWQAGTYTVTLSVSDGTNTSTTSQTIVVTSPTFDYSQYSFTINGSSQCAPLSVDVNYTGTLSGTWVWDMGDGNVVGGNQTSFNYVYTTPGLYTNTITITENGCTQTFWLDSLSVNNGLCVNADITDVSCNPPTLGSIDLTINGGTAPYTFLWSNGATTEDISGLTEGNYIVTITDAAGATATETYTIDNSIIDLDFVVGRAACDGTGGSLDMTISGGAAPYTIAWSTGAIGATSLTNLDAGGYSVTVTDANGCSDHEAVFVLYEDTCQINVSGTLYIDQNLNCTYDVGTDLPLQGWVNSSSGWGAHTSSSGTYALTATPGPLQIQSSLWYNISPYYSLYCPANNLHTLPFQDTDTTGIDFAFRADTSVHDLDISQWVSVIRPGFNNWVHLNVCNDGTFPETSTVTWVHDTAVDFTSATPAPTSYDATTRTATWVLSTLNPLECENIQIQGYADPTRPLGLPVTHVASVAGVPGETVLANNVDTTTRIVVGSYDPNDKQVSPAGEGRSGNVDIDEEWFTYTIRFQNTGTDTAFYVAIRDTLDSDFIAASLQPLAHSHPYTLTVGESGELEFFHDWILLPDSGTNLEASQGFVSYRIRRRDGMELGDQLTNRAAIYFDFNAPIITNTTVSTLTRTVSIVSPAEASVRLYPNPTHHMVWVESDQGSLQEVQIMNATGQSLLTTAVEGTRQQLDVSYLPVGLYLLKVQTTQGNSVHKLIIEE